MVSTRSQSVLSADAHNDTAATAGEVNSAGPGPTPRRSGRLRGAATPSAAAAADQAPPASARTARSRRPLKAIAEEQEPAAVEQQAARQQAEQQQEEEGAGEQLSPRARRRSAAAAAAVQPPAAEEEQADETAAPAAREAAAAGLGAPLKADAAVVDLLAQEMFAALDGAFGAAGGGGSSSSESESDAEEAPAARPAADEQQQQQQGAAAGGYSSSEEEGSDSEGEGQGHHVPAHLRWRPELTLPGMGPQQQRGGGGSQAGPAAAAAAAAAPGVHVVRRGGRDSLHVPPPDERAAAKAARKAAPETAGKAWFDLPATKITEEVKADLRMLRLRCAGRAGWWGCRGRGWGACCLAQRRCHCVRSLVRACCLADSCVQHMCLELTRLCTRARLAGVLASPRHPPPTHPSPPPTWLPPRCRHSAQGCAGPQGPLQEAGRNQVPQVLPNGHGGGGRGRLLLGCAELRLGVVWCGFAAFFLPRLFWRVQAQQCRRWMQPQAAALILPAGLCCRASPQPLGAGRLTNKQRKRTLTEEILADEGLAQVGSLPLLPCCMQAFQRGEGGGPGCSSAAGLAQGCWHAPPGRAGLANSAPQLERCTGCLSTDPTHPSSALAQPFSAGAQEALQQAAGGAQLLGQEEAGAQDGERAAEEGAPPAQALSAACGCSCGRAGCCCVVPASGATFFSGLG